MYARQQLLWVIFSLFFIFLTANSVSAMLNPTLGRFMQEDLKGYINGCNKYEIEGENSIIRLDSKGTDFATFAGLGTNYGGIGNSHGCCNGKCGKDITDKLHDIERQLTQEYNNLSTAEKNTVANNASSLDGWDIYDLAFNKSSFGGTGDGDGTVTVAGHCYRAEQVNYYLWGLLASLHPVHQDPAQDLYDANATVSIYRIALWWWQIPFAQGSIGGRMAWTDAGFAHDPGLPSDYALPCPPNPEKYTGSLWSYLGNPGSGHSITAQ